MTTNKDKLLANFVCCFQLLSVKNYLNTEKCAFENVFYLNICYITNVTAIKLGNEMAEIASELRAVNFDRPLHDIPNFVSGRQMQNKLV